MKPQQRSPFTGIFIGALWLASTMGSLAACGGGGSESESWSVDDVDAGASRSGASKTSDSGGSDKVGSGGAGKKSDAKAGSGGGSANAANGGQGGQGGSSGSSGSKASASRGGSGGSKANTGKAGAGGASAGGKAAVFPAACDACAKADEYCKNYHACADFGRDKAKAGPKAGALKADLCNDLFACVLKSHCSLGPTVPIDPDALQPDECLCGSDDVACEAMPPVTDGPCAMEVLAACETTTVLDANVVIVDDAYAAGGVFQEVRCRAARCAKSCGYCDPKDPSCVDLGGSGESAGDLDGGV